LLTQQTRFGSRVRKSVAIALALSIVPAAAIAQRPGSGHPAAHPAFGGWHAAPPISHAVPPARLPQGTPPRIAPNRTVHGTPYYQGTTHYRNPGTLNAFYARHPNSYPGGAWVYTNGRRWYNGYWHRYWTGAHWTWFRGFYGFWFPLNLLTVFVYEAAPGVCDYWDGYEWIPYYDPLTGYYCPY
jgi:hypothetical protein